MAEKTKVAKKEETATVTPSSKDTKQDWHQRHEHDTWSPEYQIRLLGNKIVILQDHLQKNHKDYDAKRSLLKLVQKRRMHLKYLKTNKLESYLLVSKKTWLKV